MTTTLTTSMPQWLAGATYDDVGGNDLRNSDVTAGWLDTGILTGSSVGVWAGVTSGAALKVSTASGMTITVGPGSFVVPNTASAVAGGYRSTLASSGTLSVASADPTNPRIDIVVAWVNDLGTSSSGGQVQIYTGTPASSPSAPSAPANSVILAQIAVPAMATSITSGNIADERTFTAAAGGIVIAPKSGGLPGGYNGLMCYDPASGSFYHMSAAGVRQAHVLPFAPVHTISTASRTLGSTIGTILSSSVTTDGMTDLKISYRAAEIQASALATISFYVEIDGTILEAASQSVPSGYYISASGIVYTSPAASTTPSAGTHTITLRASAAGGAVLNSSAAADQGVYLRIEPVGL